MEKQYDREESGFWTERGDKCTVLGDVLGRLPSLELLAAQSNEVVLDVGCGAGWCTRRLARTGAKVVGFDVSSAMLNAAKASEKAEPLGITYLSGDLTKAWPIESGSVDAVWCVAVLMHVTPSELQHFFSEARRVLRPSGRLVVSLSHREVLRQQALVPGWVRYDTGTWDTEGNALATEHYFDGSGREFISSTWLHNLVPAAQKAGFEIVKHCDRLVTREALAEIYGKRSVEWPIGYAAFEQIVAR